MKLWLFIGCILTQFLRIISNNKSSTRDSNFTFDNLIESDINVDGDDSMRCNIDALAQRRNIHSVKHYSAAEYQTGW